MELMTLGFLGIHRFENDAATRGAMLVTDMQTKPLEFRVTAPVRPQKFQNILYGELLDEHLAVELVGFPLLNSLQQKPDVIIVRDILFLGMNNKKEIPVILILKEDDTLTKKGIFTEQLNPTDSAHPSAKICTTSQFETNLGEIAQQLQSIFSNKDLIEPFNRIQKACEDVHTRKVGDD